MLTVMAVAAHVDRGRPPRDLRLSDYVPVPVSRPGSFPLRDMLNLRSVEALWVANNRAQEAQDQRLAQRRAPAKRQRANRA